MTRLREIADSLSDYAELEGSELGEMWSLMAQLAYYEDYMGEEFANALLKEMTEQLEYVQENTEIATETEMIPTKVTRLNWKDC